MIDIDEQMDEEAPPSTAPALPPGLAELNSVPRDVFFKEMERHPLFMRTLDQSDPTENIELEALRALAYEGTPSEIAKNFKTQGNDAFHERRYRDALEFYSKGLAAKSGEVEIEKALLLNRAAVNLELENYGDVLRDCGRVLADDEASVKALYRSARACLAIDKLDEAEDAIARALVLEPSNPTFQKLKQDIAKRKGIIDIRNQEIMAKAARKREEERTLKSALKVREITVVATSHPPDLGPISPYHLSDPLDPHSDLCFPTILLYPLSSQTDLIAEFPLSSSLIEQLSVVLEAPPAWDTQYEYTVDNVDCFMEIEKDTGRGLIKIGPKIIMEKALKGRVIHDGIVRIFVLPKTKSQNWIARWKTHNTQVQ